MKKSDIKLVENLGVVAGSAYSEIEQAKEPLIELRDGLQEAYDEKGDKWKEGEKGLAAETIIEAINAIIEAAESAMTSLEEIQNACENIKEPD